MSRCLLHLTKLDDFKEWLTAHGIEHAPSKGEYEVLRVHLPKGWQCVFSRHDMPEHYTVARPLEKLVRRFIASRKEHKPFTTRSR